MLHQSSHPGLQQGWQGKRRCRIHACEQLAWQSHNKQHQHDNHGACCNIGVVSTVLWCTLLYFTVLYCNVVNTQQDYSSELSSSCGTVQNYWILAHSDRLSLFLRRSLPYGLLFHLC